MKKNKCIAALLSAVLLLTCISCGIAQTETEFVPDQPEILTHIFRGEKIELPEGYSPVRTARPLYDSENEEYTFVCSSELEITDTTREVTALDTEYRMITTDRDFTVTDDRILPIRKSLGGNAPTYLRLTDTDAVFLWSSYNIETGEKPLYLGICDLESGETVTTDDITPLFASPDAGTKYFMPVGFEVDRNGQIYLAADEELLIFDKNGIRITQYTSSAWINTLTLASDGNVCVSGVFDSGSGLHPIDADSLAMKTKITVPDTKNITDCYFGDGYELYYVHNNSLFGLNDQNAEIVMNYENSNLSDLDILRVIDSETILALDQKNGVYSLMIYRKAPDVDLTQLKTIDLATADGLDSTDISFIVEYNKANPDRRVVVTDYSESGGADKLTTDILTGVYKPDIIEGDAESELMRQIIAHKLYADLNPYLASDDRVNHENIFGGVKRTFDDGGNMWGITSAFSVSTMITQHSAVGIIDAWTAEEMIDTALSLGKDKVFVLDLISRRTPDNWGTEPSELFGPAGYGAFVDMKSGAASFDSEIFMKYLEFIKNLPDKVDTSKLKYGIGESYLFNQADGKCAADTVILESSAHWLWLDVLFDTEEFSITGYPVSDKNTEYGSYLSCEGAFVIMAGTEFPAEAWDAVKMFFPEYEDKSGLYYLIHRGFPALKSVMSDYLEDDLNCEFTFWYSSASSYGRGWYDPENPSDPADYSEPVKFSYMTEEAADALTEFLDTKVGSALASKVHDDIIAIVNEEISAFTAGIGTTEDCAKKIQSRVELWLAEHES